MRLRIVHHTLYVYSQPVSLAPHLLYLRPRDSSTLRVTAHHLELTPVAHHYDVRDPHDNTLTWTHFTQPASSLEIVSTSEVETVFPNPFDFILKPYAAPFPFAYEPLFDFALGPCLAPPFDATQAQLRDWLDANFHDRPRETVPFLTSLNSLLYQKFRYTRRDEPGIQPSLSTLALGSGACRDLAVLLVELCRTLGLAARFVSGYLYAAAGDDQRTAGAMHAWTEVYLPGAGWRGLDPTHGIWCDEAFVPVAHAAQAESVNPVQGSFSCPAPATARLDVSVSVTPL